MAFERIEPFGALHDEFMHGQQCALTFNANRDTEKSKALSAGDFMPALGRVLGKNAEKPILLDDPEEQSKLLRGLFKANPDG